jgi:hypothetical protein
LCASNLVLAEAIRHFKQQDHRVMCLGGGYGSKDSLLNFKLSFSSTTLPFRTFRKVHDEGAFKEACAQFGVEVSVDRYFPPYRDTTRSRTER